MIRIETSLGDYGKAVEERVRRWSDDGVATRLWARDATLWSGHTQASGISDRLGWLDLPRDSEGLLRDLSSLVSEIPFWMSDIVLVGMGGSSLAPWVTTKICPGQGLQLTLVDSTHPGTIRDLEWINPANTVFVIASKSGTTIETLSLFRHFWSRTEEVVDDPGAHFVAITDEGSPLQDVAVRHGFRSIWNAPSDVGGRFSAISAFGLVPAALSGVDVAALLREAEEASELCQVPGADNPGVVLGAALGELARQGRDKLTFLTASGWESFPAWAEQLVAESLGKDGKGIIPVAGERLPSPDLYGDDRVFVGLLNHESVEEEAKQWGEPDHTREFLEDLEALGHPVIRFTLEDPHEVGALFFTWEVGVALAGKALGVQPFDQPDVEIAKQLARRAMKRGGRTDSTDDEDPDTPSVDLVWERPPWGHHAAQHQSPPDADHLASTVHRFLQRVPDDGYVAIQAFVRSELDETFTTLREVLSAATGAAVTLGFGPRFLHSTGQLHKGGGDACAFLQLMDGVGPHVPVPGLEYSFRHLFRAQAEGDAQALAQRGRNVLRARIGSVDSPASPEDGPDLGLSRLIDLIISVGGLAAS